METEKKSLNKELKSKYDEPTEAIADYVSNGDFSSQEAYDTAYLCLIDSIGCMALALGYQECKKLLGPIVPGISVPYGTRIPGTNFILDPMMGAFNIGTLIRWLDYNDTFLAAEWGHPSDNLGGILAIADYISQKNISEGKKPLLVNEIFTAMIKAHEVQGGLALLNSFNRIGFDHVILVKVATAAVTAFLLGGNKKQIMDAVSQAWVDAGPLRTYRHSPNTGSRKSWAAGDATSRGVFLALMTMKGEMGYPSVLSAKKWGLYEVLFEGKPFRFERPFESYVMENVLFKISFPAEFHAQTAVEAAIQLHPQVVNRLEEIDWIDVETHESAIRIIDKIGPLNNPADRDHCLQYMIAIGLIFGDLTANHYEEKIAIDPRIDSLREKMKVRENIQYTNDYLDPEKRSIANALTVHFKDGTKTIRMDIEYPLGHKRRRKQGIPYLYEKLRHNLRSHYKKNQANAIYTLLKDKQKLTQMPVNDLMSLLTVQSN